MDPFQLAFAPNCWSLTSRVLEWHLPLFLAPLGTRNKSVRTCLGVVVALLTIAAVEVLRASDLQVSSDFPGGSARVLKLDQAARSIHLKPTAHENRGWVCWWYFKLSGVKPGETISVTVGDAPWATPDRAAYSVDGATWLQTTPGKRKGNEITYRQPVDAAECFFAWGPPFTPTDAQRLVDDAAKNSPHAQAFTLCRTRYGRAVPALRVREANGAIEDRDRHGIWIQARQHAWESGSSWVCRGFVEWLVSDDDRAARLRKTSIINIVPIMDVDNVTIGAGGKNEVPQDHNRDWTDAPHHNSVRAAMQAIKGMNETSRFAVFVDLHNPSSGARDPFFYVTPRDLLSDEGNTNVDRFLATMRLDMTGPLAFKGQVETSGPNYDKQWRNISKNWVAFNTSDRVVAVTLETAWNTPHSTTDGYRIVGSQLGQGLERYFRTAEAAE